ncbi:MAG: bifunctional oligoribonuclease/PAP phosphatase NrnA [Chloroflexota bacterium]
MWQEIIPLIENNRTFLITSHTNPDCDALGSELALAEHLRCLGKQVAIINNDAVPTPFRFLDPRPRGTIKRYSQSKHARIIQQADVIFVLDASGGWGRVGSIGQALAQAQATKVCIDHHPDTTDFVDLAVVDTEAAATAELIYSLLLTIGGRLTPTMAQALYAAIVTDTGSFRFPKTSPQTHRITAELLAAGANPAYIYSQLYEQYSLGRVRLKGHVINSIKTEANGQIAHYGLDRATLKAYGVKVSDLDGFASLGQEIGGVRVTVFCLESSRQRVKISLRSDGSAVINQIAAEYNGGGHPSAAGATVEGKLDEILAEVVANVKQLLVSPNGD